MLSTSWSFSIALLIHYNTHTHEHKQASVEHNHTCRDIEQCSWTDVDQVVKEPVVQGLGQGVSGEGRLLCVQSDRDGLRLPAPLTVHHSAGQFTAQTFLRDSQQEGWERQD